MCVLFAGNKIRDLFLLSGESADMTLDAPCPEARGVVVCGEMLRVGDMELLSLSSCVSPEQRLLLAAAAHAVFCLAFAGPGKHTLGVIYTEVLGFTTRVTLMAQGVVKKLRGGKGGGK